MKSLIFVIWNLSKDYYAQTLLENIILFIVVAALILGLIIAVVKTFL